MLFTVDKKFLQSFRQKFARSKSMGLNDFLIRSNTLNIRLSHNSLCVCVCVCVCLHVCLCEVYLYHGQLVFVSNLHNKYIKALKLTMISEI